MGFARGPKIVTDSLRMVVDPSSDRSYVSGSGATVYNLVPNRSNGTIVGGVTYSEENGGVFDFEGSADRINFGGKENYLPMEDLSLEAWFKGGLGAGQGIGGLISVTYGITMYVDSIGRVRARCTESGSGVYQVTLGTSGVDVGDDQWHHAVYTLSGSGDMTIYVDGEFNITVGTAIWNGNTIWNVANNDVWVGVERNNVNANAFSGSIGVARIYSKTLSADEVLQNYNAQKSRFGKE